MVGLILGVYVVFCCGGFGVRRWWGGIWALMGAGNKGDVLLGLWFFFFIYIVGFF